MSFRLIYTKSYLRRAAKFAKRHPELLGQYEKSLKLLELNPFHPSLRLHKLRGKLEGLWSISIDRKYRLIFKALENGVILFISIGLHAIYEKK